ncbi:MAG TPA: sulfotransferase, partial [Rhodanobacteraceae bacterium]|nr:sulfotransferase [Rhodanobacteraceae bacterium]
PELAGNPTRAALGKAMATYRAQAMQDDRDDARWFIDKQPLNFRYIDLILAMFPNAKIIHCQRDSRATALSLWMQSFNEDVQGYAYDPGSIALVMRACERLMNHWHQRYPDSIRAARYEDLVPHTRQQVESLAAWIGLPAPWTGEDDAVARSPGTISSASLWQARQPVYSRSLEHWKHYAGHLPELLHPGA